MRSRAKLFSRRSPGQYVLTLRYDNDTELREEGVAAFVGMVESEEVPVALEACDKGDPGE